ncbi:hypothetical protein [Paenibacillus tarimensis]|uniref:hypothetical protein n=1 Tax=Paenibacillus tarimensis TaxID=416012 RepID=UPI001F198387|nr:hypothetical protein [Paenibacillus tarimensis]MCF2945858.1 hypothetical protein [Paenibacillus tarimensis]
MEKKMMEWIAYTESRIDLSAYKLHACAIRRSHNFLSETLYTLEMEWFPIERDGRSKDGYNPPGTAIIELDLAAMQFTKILYVGGVSLSSGPIIETGNAEAAAAWIEQETGLQYRKQFCLSKQTGNEYQFSACYEGIPISPQARIDLKLDQTGKLVLYSRHGRFAAAEEITPEPFTLTLDGEVQQIAAGQLRRLTVPANKTRKWLAVYGLEEVYIAQDRKTLIPIRTDIDEAARCDVNERMEWETPLEHPYERRPLNLTRHPVTVEQVLEREPDPDMRSLTPEERELAKHAVLGLLRSKYPEDSGRWNMVSLSVRHGYVIAKLKVPDDWRFPGIKMIVHIDRVSMEVVNWMDTLSFLDLYNDYEPADYDEPLSLETACSRLHDKLRLDPVYVYDFELRRYRLCGKLDSDYGVLAHSGEVISLQDL